VDEAYLGLLQENEGEDSSDESDSGESESEEEDEAEGGDGDDEDEEEEEGETPGGDAGKAHPAAATSPMANGDQTADEAEAEALRLTGESLAAGKQLSKKER
jgi:U3 small nucleolar RNA-associated protein 14